MTEATILEPIRTAPVSILTENDLRSLFYHSAHAVSNLGTYGGTYTDGKRQLGHFEGSRIDSQDFCGHFNQEHSM